MSKQTRLRYLCIASSVFASGLVQQAHAGSFGIREQSAYFQGMSFAGSAAGGDISSMYWNSAATATLPGFNTSSSSTIVVGRSEESAQGGAFLTGSLAGTPTSSDVGSSGYVPSSFATYQLSDRLYAGLGLNAPFGFVTSADRKWAGSPIAETSKVFSIDINPTLAYKLTPQLSVGIGAQIEYFKLRITRSEFDTAPFGAGGPVIPASGSRSYDANDWGIGATAGVMWQPMEGTSFGVGYRSQVDVDPNGYYKRGAYIAGLPTTPTPRAALGTHATSSVTLPDEITLSARQQVTNKLIILGTVEWTNWSSVKNVVARGDQFGNLETLHLNYRDGWLYSIGAEYAYSPSLTLRTGLGYERSPISDNTRDTLLPDADRIHLSFGASYKYSDKITVNLGYSHLFVDDAPFCIATTDGVSANHCRAGAPVLLTGTADSSIDIVSLGINYKMSGPTAALEPYK